MDTSVKQDAGREIFPEENPTCKVVILYENFECGAEAMATYDFLLTEQGRQCFFTSTLWKLDRLMIPTLREAAACEAAEANIILLAGYGDNPMPDHLRRWIKDWLKMRGNDSQALVLLMKRFSKSNQECLWHQEISKVVDNHNVDLFCKDSLAETGLPAAFFQSRVVEEILAPPPFTPVPVS